MSIDLEDKRSDHLDGARTSERRHSVPQSEAQRYASAENFALFILTGICKHVNNERFKTIVSPDIINMIEQAAQLEMMRIRFEQSLRKKTKGGN